MKGLQYLAAMAVLSAGQPLAAAGPDPVQAVILGAPQSGAVSTYERRHTTDEVRGALVAASMTGGGLDMAAASHRSRETQRRIVRDNSAEAALLAGAGIMQLRDVPPLPFCDDEQRRLPCRDDPERGRNR